MATPTYAAVVGRFVRLERECQSIGLQAFAKKVHYSPSGWSRVETGDTPMSIEQLKRACDALGILPSKVLEEVDEFWRRNHA